MSLIAQQPDSIFWVPNGPVNSLVLHDTTVIIGGDFDQLSPVTGSFIRLDTSTAQVDPSLFKVNGAVYAIFEDTASGYIYVGGSFTRVGNQSAENIFRLKPDGTFDNTFSHAVNGTVYAIDKHDTDLFIGGDFTQIDGQTRNYFGGIQLNTGDLNYCDPDLNGPVYCMALDVVSGTIIIGGDFTQLQTFNPPYIAKIVMTTGGPITFNAVPWTAVPNVNGPVYDVELRSGMIFMCGEFTQFSSVPRRGLAAILNINGNLQAPNAGVVGSVYTLEIIASSIYIGGAFSSAGLQPRANLACLDFNFTALPWNPGTNGIVRDISVVDSDELFIGGNYSVIGGDTSGRGAIVDRFTGTVRNWNPEINGPVYASAIDAPGRLYVGGDFFGSGGELRKNLCALSVNTGLVTAWNPAVNNTVHTMTLDGDTLYFAGDFAVVGATSRGRAAAIDLNGFSLLPFNPIVNGLVRTITVTDSAVYMGGNFTSLGGQPRNNIGKVSKSTSLATPWNPNCFGTVNKILVDQSWVYVAGFYSTISGVSRENLSRLNPNTATADWNWICDTDDGIYEAEFYNGKLALGGWFNTVNGQTSPDFALVDTVSLQLTPVNFACDGFVSSFTTYGDDFFLAGNYNLVNAQIQPSLSAYDEGNSAVDPWTPAPNAPPKCLQATATRLFLGGGMTTTAGRFHPHLQVLTIQGVTGLDEQHQAVSAFTVYPVPAGDFITIESEKNFTTYTITDITGKIVQTGELQTGNSGQTISLADLSAGMYILNLTSPVGESSAQKIVVE